MSFAAGFAGASEDTGRGLRPSEIDGLHLGTDTRFIVIDALNVVDLRRKRLFLTESNRYIICHI
jgi:hypothetical protein